MTEKSKQTAPTFTMTTARPVIIYYDYDVAPDELHPAGMLAGASYECPSPELAKKFHPHARILRYVDGGDYSDSKATRELRDRDKLAAEPVEEPKPAKGKRTLTAEQKAEANERRKAQRAAQKAQADAMAPNTDTGPIVALSGSQGASEHNTDVAAAEMQAATMTAKAEAEHAAAEQG